MASCYFCGHGQLVEQYVTLDVRRGDRLIVVENVPARVCDSCGEQYFSAEVSRRLDHLLAQGKPERTIEVPVCRLA